MCKVRCYITDIYRIATIIGVTFAMWKLVRHWHAGLAEKTGHAIDASISAAAKKLEITANLLEEWADTGLGENLGKSLDEVLADTKKTLEKATGLVQGRIKPSELRRKTAS
jgi:hypothetical protein